MTDRELLELILNKVTNLESKVTNLESKVTNLEFEQQQIKQAVLETNAAVKRLEERIEQHESILDLLSKRSIQQEAELKRMSIK